MLRLMNQILDFRKIENKKMKVLLEKSDIITLLQRVMDNFLLIAEEKHIDFRLHSQPDIISGWIDQDKFEKIFFNLISNAFKYTPDNKSITVSASMVTNGIRILVIETVEVANLVHIRIRTCIRRIRIRHQVSR